MARMKSKGELGQKDVRKLIQEYWEAIGAGNGREKDKSSGKSERFDLRSSLELKGARL